MSIDDINIIGIDMPEDKWLMMSQGDELREVLSVMSAHYTVPDIKYPELPNQVAENNEASEEQVAKIRAIASLASSGFHVPFKTICEALGFDSDQMMEDLRAEDNEESSMDYKDIIDLVKNNDHLEFESFCIVNNANYDIMLYDLIDGEGRNFHIPSGSQEIDFKAGLWSNTAISDSMIINSKDLWREIANDGLILTQVSIRTKPSVAENKKPKRKSKKTTITEDMMNYLLK